MSEDWKDRPLAERKRLAVELRKQGIGPVAIARQLGLGTAKRVDKIVSEELAKDAPRDSALSWQVLELSRLDDIWARLSQRMRNKEKGVEREMLKVMDYRVRLQSAQDREPGRMFRAVERALQGLDLAMADEAAKQSALDMATMIDVAMSVGTADDQRRAINAMATMRNLLNDLGASPAAREEVDGIANNATKAVTDAEAEPAETNEPEKGAEVLSFAQMARSRFASGGK